MNKNNSITSTKLKKRFVLRDPNIVTLIKVITANSSRKPFFLEQRTT